MGTETIEGVAVYDDNIPLVAEPAIKKEEPKVPVKKEVEKEPTPVEPTLEDKREEEASKHGWRPLEEWKGDPLEWRNAEVFLERGKYFNIMKDQKTKIDHLELKIDDMAKYQKDLRLAERRKVLNELSEQKLQALENEEYAKVVEIDNKIHDERMQNVAVEATEESKPAQAPTSPEDQEVWNRFVGENGWYTADSKKRAYADAIGIQYKQDNQFAPISEILEYVQNEVAALFESTQSATPPASPVSNNRSRSSQSPRKGGKKKLTINDLDPMQKEMGQTFVDQGAFDSIDDYIASLEEIGGLE